MPDLPSRKILETLLNETAERHQHLCPRQVLGVRLGLFGLKRLGLLSDNCQTPFRNEGKRLLTIVETDGCGADGIAVATDCAIGRRTLRVMDFGKVGATLVDTHSGRSLRVSPKPDARKLAVCRVPEAPSRWHAYLDGYQVIEDEAMFQVKAVTLTRSIAEILSTPDKRALCAECGEEIINEREVVQEGRTLCRSCAGLENYYV